MKLEISNIDKYGLDEDEIKSILNNVTSKYLFSANTTNIQYDIKEDIRKSIHEKTLQRRRNNIINEILGLPKSESKIVDISIDIKFK